MNHHAIRASIEQALSHALAQHDTGAVEDCTTFLRLIAPAQYERYGFDRLKKAWPVSTFDDRLEQEFSVALPPLTGDPARVLLCLRILLNNLYLGSDTLLLIETAEQQHTVGRAPCLTLRFLGPGHVPEHIAIGGYFRMNRQEFSDCWTRATRDGRIDLTPEGLTLWLQGSRETPPAYPDAEALHEWVKQPPLLDAAHQALTQLDGDSSALASNLPLVINEVIKTRTEALETAGIALSVDLQEPLPPLILRRTRVQDYVAALLDLALWNGAPGTTVRLHMYTLPEARVVRLDAEIDLPSPPGVTFFTASMARAADAHGAQYEAHLKMAPARITLALPEQVGRRLDEWLPGWEVFSQRSQQFLRLLKSGAAPSEDVVILGVLEEELERWLLPLLSTPLAHNLARALSADGARTAFAHPERAEKALAQVARGKPKKELAEPAYAAELLHAFATTPKGREALQASAEDLARLCDALINAPLDALRSVACLRGMQNPPPV